MCFRIVDGNLTIVSYKKFFSILTGSVALIGVTIVQCNNGVAFAQEKLVKPEAEKVCDNKIKKYDSATIQVQIKEIICKIEKNQQAIIKIGKNTELSNEILKGIASKSVIRTAVKNLENRGKIPVDEYRDIKTD